LPTVTPVNYPYGYAPVNRPAPYYAPGYYPPTGFPPVGESGFSFGR
jgi:hypothetical protein